MSRQDVNLAEALVSPEVLRLGRNYPHWDDLFYRPLPPGLTRDGVWLALKVGRQAGRVEVPLKDGAGRGFSYSVTEELMRRLDELDSSLTPRGGQVLSVSSNDAKMALSESLMEESITSSLLEGAPTTKAEAQAMFLKKSPPRSIGERMVYGSYQAMAEIYRETEQPMTMERLLHIHRLFTEGSIALPDAAGRFRRMDETVRVADGEGRIYHTPPASGDTLVARVARILDFANGSSEMDGSSYVPPIIRAIIVHFALAFEHPFVDGNGRVARALMYWTLLHAGCSGMRGVSISEQLRRAPMQYARAFLLVETDDNDLTYFLLHQTETLLAAFREREHRRKEEINASDQTLPPRLRRLVTELRTDPSRPVTIAGYCDFAHVSYATGRSDLIELEKRKLLSSAKEGHARVYRLVK